MAISAPTFPYSLSLFSLSFINRNFCGPVSVDLVDRLLSLRVHDPDVAICTLLSHFKLNCDLSLSSLASNEAEIEFICLVNQGGEKGARLVRREVA